MQPGGFGGPPGGQGPGQPPGGYYGGGPQQPGQPGAQHPQQPGAAPQAGQQYGGAPAAQQYPGAQYPAAQHPAAQHPAAQHPAAQYPAAQYPGMPQGAAQHAGMPQAGAQQYPGMPGQGVPGQGVPGQGMPGQAGAHNPYGHAQKALSGAGSMMSIMKWAFVGIGALCILGGVAMIFTVDVVSGASTAFTGAILVAVAFLVLPRFTGMVGDATKMVDGLASKAQLAQTGIPANGRLIQVQQTGRLVNYSPEIQATVEVQHPQFGTYQVQTTAVVPQIAIPRAQQGAQVQVRINPQNQQDIALVF